MTGRDRLLKLVCTDIECDRDCSTCEYRCADDECVKHYGAIMVDFFLANGVIVPPVKLGDVVYVIERCRCLTKAYIAGRCHHRETVRTPRACAGVMLKQLGKRPVDVRDGKVVLDWRPIGTVCYKVVRRPFELKYLHKLGETVFPSLEEAVAALNKKTEGGIEYGV